MNVEFKGEAPAFNYIIKNLGDDKFKTLVEKLAKEEPDLFQKIYKNLSSHDFQAKKRYYDRCC